LFCLRTKSTDSNYSRFIILLYVLFPLPPSGASDHLCLRRYPPAIPWAAEGRIHLRRCAASRGTAISDAAARSAPLPHCLRGVGHAWRRHLVYRPRGTPRVASNGSGESRGRVVPLYGSRGPGGGTLRAGAARSRISTHGAFCHAPRAGGCRGEDLRIFPCLPCRQQPHAAFPLELQDALRQDLRSLPAGAPHGMETAAGSNLQTRRAECLGRGPAHACRFRRVAVPVAQFGTELRNGRPQPPDCLLRVVSGFSRTQQVGWHQAKERMGTCHQLGLCDSRRISLRCLARPCQGSLRERRPPRAGLCRRGRPRLV